MRDIDELRPLTAGRLLALWREARESSEDPLERALLCNAGIAAACCFRRGKPVFADRQAALAALTGRQLERLLLRLAEAEPAPAGTEALSEATGNPAFDQRRFDALREG